MVGDDILEIGKFDKYRLFSPGDSIVKYLQAHHSLKKNLLFQPKKSQDYTEEEVELLGFGLIHHNNS